MLTLKPAFSGAMRVCVGAGLPGRRAQRPVRPPIHQIRTPCCVSIPRTLVTSMSRCARDPPPVSPLPGVRGESQEGRGSHTLLRRPRSRPLPVPNLNGSKGGEREVLAGAEAGVAGVAGVAPPRLPPARPLRGLAYILPFRSGRGRPPGAEVREVQGRGCRSTPGAEKWVPLPDLTVPRFTRAPPALGSRSKATPLASVRSRLRPAPGCVRAHSPGS